jgi:hypothetical protein
VNVCFSAFAEYVAYGARFSELTSKIVLVKIAAIKFPKMKLLERKLRRGSAGD